MTFRGADPPPPAGSRLLLIKPKMIGDTLLATPAIQAVRRTFPGLAIDLLVRAGSEGVLAGCPGLGRLLLTVPPDSERRDARAAGFWPWLRHLRSVRYDLACDLTGTERGHFILLATRARRKFAAPAAADLHQPGLWRRLVPTLEIPSWPRLHAVERDAAVLAAILGRPLDNLTLTFEPAAPPAPPTTLPAIYAVVHPASRVAAKIWPEERWQAVVRSLAATCGHVVLSSGPAAAEVELSRRLAAAALEATTVTAGSWSWATLAGVMRRARIFVGADTAAAHLAAAVGLPSVVLWGPSHENIWAPWSDRAWLVIDDAVVAAAATRHRQPAPGDLTRSVAANRLETVAEAIGRALGL